MLELTIDLQMYTGSCMQPRLKWTVEVTVDEGECIICVHVSECMERLPIQAAAKGIDPKMPILWLNPSAHHLLTYGQTLHDAQNKRRCEAMPPNNHAPANSESQASN